MPQRRPRNLNGGPPVRPMPDDFRRLAALHPNRWLAKHFETGTRQVRRWREECGITLAPKEIPAEFYELAAVKSNAWLMEHFEIGNNRLWRWRKKTGIPAPKVLGKFRPVPKDFAAVAPGKTVCALRRHYRSCDDTVKRWAKEAGIELATRPAKGMFANRTASGGRAFAAHRKRLSHTVATATRALKVAPPKLTDDEDRAADFLRRHAVIYRCDSQGKMLSDGFFWRFGNAVLEPAELMARARRHGFDPDAWKQVAA